MLTTCDFTQTHTTWASEQLTESSVTISKFCTYSEYIHIYCTVLLSSRWKFFETLIINDTKLTMEEIFLYMNINQSVT
jgi:hypothetical protein